MASIDPVVAAEVARRSDDGIAFRARPGHTHHTWARTFSSLPELYIQPESVAEVEKAIDIARVCRRRITTTGCGHSPSNITCTSSWLVNIDRVDQVHSIDPETGIAVVGAGMRLYALCEELDRHGLAMPNLGSITEQSVAGAISTGTHGSSSRHGLISENIVALKITLASGKTVSCSADENPDLFRAALISLGALGIITEISIRAVPAFNLKWEQTIDSDQKLFDAWNRGFWEQSEFVRVYWLPYTRRAVVWRADKTDEELTPYHANYFDGPLGFHIYHNLLALSNWIPAILPWVEWFVYGMQCGFANGTTVSASQPSRQALLLNCLYSQFVNEWALPLHRGPEAIARLSSWLNRLTPADRGYVPHGIPFSSRGLYVHAPLEVRVTDSTANPSPRPFLDHSCADGPTLYLNATLYRPYLRDPPARARFYEAFEWLMRDMGGRPHWAKNFESSRGDVEAAFGADLDAWRAVRDGVDGEGMFVGPWHRQRVMPEGPRLPREEVETSREKASDGGLLTFGTVS
jgi:D-arabinono-1,4-lactone oxidase